MCNRWSLAGDNAGLLLWSPMWKGFWRGPFQWGVWQSFCYHLFCQFLHALCLFGECLLLIIVQCSWLKSFIGLSDYMQWNMPFCMVSNNDVKAARAFMCSQRRLKWMKNMTQYMEGHVNDAFKNTFKNHSMKEIPLPITEILEFYENFIVC